MMVQVVAEARKRLLEEHGAKLAGYLPKVNQYARKIAVVGA